MSSLWPVGALIGIVVGVLLLSRARAWQRLFHWLPIPLWCYALPLVAVTLGWLPHDAPLYRTLTNRLLPLALGLLLLGVNLPAVIQTSRRALVAAAVGAAAIMAAAPIGVVVLQRWLPPQAWTGAGALAGTWTGGTMNLLALRSVLEIPDSIFAPIIVVDAVVAYSWMALLVAASGFQQPINRWLGATAAATARAPGIVTDAPRPSRRGSVVLCAVVALSLALIAQRISAHLPTSKLVTSSTGWAVLLVTTAALGLSLIPRVRRVGERGSILGYPCLYLVLAATGAQADLHALWSAPAWLVLGAGIAILHGASLLLVGRLCRIPLGVLATASQANIGGVVSAPLVGAVYDQSLAPVGLLLAMAFNALGTYLGWLSATFCRWLLHV